jgi:hypothetical protein
MPFDLGHVNAEGRLKSERTPRRRERMERKKLESRVPGLCCAAGKFYDVTERYPSRNRTEEQTECRVETLYRAHASTKNGEKQLLTTSDVRGFTREQLQSFKLVEV